MLWCRNKFEDVDSWMRQRKLPKRTRKKIHAYYSEVWVRQAGEWLCCPVMCYQDLVLAAAVCWHCGEAFLHAGLCQYGSR